MRLGDAVKALEARHLISSIDLGVHEYCEADSNCPRAIELRKIMTEAGMGEADLLIGQAALNVPDPINTISYPITTGNTATVQVLGRTIGIDLNDVVNEQLKRAIAAKLEEATNLKDQVQRIGRSLYASYAREVERVRSNVVLPQLDYSVEELAKTRCMITKWDGNYVFLFQVEYNPMYIVSNGIRSQLSAEDIARLKHNCLLQFVLTPAHKFLSQARLLDANGRKFQHYHGNSNNDCWGNIVLPPEWDQTLTSLYRLSIILMKSLGTINYNSLMQREPPDMPAAVRILDRAAEMGREGVLDEAAATNQRVEMGARWGTRRA